MANENNINHIALVLDASASMLKHASTVVRVADEQIKHLAQRSQELDQETRVTVYTFADTVTCHIFDKDVLRLPSMAGLYHAHGMTALIDASLLSVNDLDMQPQKYGDHSFLVYVLTDGIENRSNNFPTALQKRLSNLQDHWTVAALVPDSNGQQWCRNIGFTPGNIAIWDASSTKGLEDSFLRIRTATDSFMTGRTQGIRGTRSLFSMDPSVLNEHSVRAANLKPLTRSRYQVMEIDRAAEIREWVESKGRTYWKGSCYYELTKPENVQARKQIAVMNRAGEVFTGPAARQLVGLPDYEIRVRPDFNPDFRLFVQSTSVNRKLVPGTKLLQVS